MYTNYPRHIPGFQYLGCYRYFLTFCCEDRYRAFEDGAAVRLAWSQFLRVVEKERFAIIICCFMPDHAHLLVEGLEDDSDLKAFVSRAKQLSGHAFSQENDRRLWQRYCYEHVLRDQERTQEVIAYILENPVRAKLAETVYDYPHVMSTVYERKELIEFAYGPSPAKAGHYGDRSG
jgi:putative transposase